MSLLSYAARSSVRTTASSRFAVLSAATSTNKSRLAAHEILKNCQSSSSRWFSSLLVPQKPVRIYYATQTGTSQMFAMQLADAIDQDDSNNNSSSSTVIDVGSIKQPSKIFEENKEGTAVFIVSTAGVGDAPGSAQKLDTYVTETLPKDSSQGTTYSFAVFGLGNSRAHPEHYNAFGKRLHSGLTAAFGKSVVPLGLGDDGGVSIEDDFEQWQEMFIKAMKGESADDANKDEAIESATTAAPQGTPASIRMRGTSIEGETCDSDLATSSRMTTPPDPNSRIVSSTYPQLQLSAPAEFPIIKANLLDTFPDYYPASTASFKVIKNGPLHSNNPTSNGLREMRIEIDPEKNNYTAGDHFLIHPRNPDALVDAFLQYFPGIDVYSTILGMSAPPASAAKTRSYPFPIGLTVYETLSHCVDLSATPSPALARVMLQQPDLDYKNEIAGTSLLELLSLATSNRRLAFEDVLWHLSPMKPRFYSIASSPTVHPDQIFLTYRPIKYINSKTGHLQEGVCTSFMRALSEGSIVTGRIQSNPDFYLPDQPGSHILLIAGGCGVAPVRAFLEEWTSIITDKESGMASNGVVLPESVNLFLGFRSPADAVYQDLIEEAKEHINLRSMTAFSGGGCHACATPKTVTDVMLAKESQEIISNLLLHQADKVHVYVCGGAQTLGAAVRQALVDTLSTEMSKDEAAQFIQTLRQQGRYHEDLSD